MPLRGGNVRQLQGFLQEGRGRLVLHSKQARLCPRFHRAPQLSFLCAADVANRERSDRVKESIGEIEPKARREPFTCAAQRQIDLLSCDLNCNAWWKRGFRRTVGAQVGGPCWL